MDNELLLLIKKHTAKLIEQTRSRPQETLEFKLKKQVEVFSFSLPTNPFEEGNRKLVVTSFEATNSVFNITIENNSFSISTPGHRSFRGGAEIINKLQNLLEMRDNNDIKLHVEEVRKRENQMKINNFIKLSDFDTSRNETLKKIKNVQRNDPEDKVFRTNLTWERLNINLI